MKATLNQASKILSVFENVPAEQIQAALASGLLADVRDANYGETIDRDAVRKLLGLKSGQEDRSSYPVTVDYRLSLREMIAAGRYDWVNGGITAHHFPVKGEGAVDVEIRLVHFNRVMVDPDDVLREFERMNLRPATLPEGAALGAKYPDLQRQFPITILGSVWRNADGALCVPYFWYDGGKRERSLNLSWVGSRWLWSGRFAAVRE